MNHIQLGTDYRTFSRILFASCSQVASLHSLLVRMSLVDETAPAFAIRHAMAAISFQHLGDCAMASMHQTKSVNALQTTINRLGRGDVTETAQALRAMAASMLLNVFETKKFEASPLGWAVFLCGTKQIANLIHASLATYEGDLAVILDWIMYQDTLYRFGVRHWRRGAPKKVLAAQEIIFSKATFSSSRQLVCFFCFPGRLTEILC